MKQTKREYFAQEDTSIENSREEVLLKLAEYQDKYFDLVWYARTHPKDRLQVELKEIEKKYPKEVEELRKETILTSPDWSHGFNSGCLAAFRFAFTALSKTDDWEECFIEELENDDEFELQSPIELAEEEFPFLDT
tara:strand:- start:1846 stop:2253 length:408 start_codon:yes stop_codon:yes gene_type:complete